MRLSSDRIGKETLKTRNRTTCFLFWLEPVYSRLAGMANGGDPYAASSDAGAAVLNINIATAMSLLTWILLDVLYYAKPRILDSVNGMTTRLVAITRAAVVVAGWDPITLHLVHTVFLGLAII